MKTDAHCGVRFNLFLCVKERSTLIKFAIYILFLLTSTLIFSQNLVPNPSFESMNYCPVGIANPEAVSSWYNPNKSTPEYYNSCATHRPPTVFCISSRQSPYTIHHLVHKALHPAGMCA